MADVESKSIPHELPSSHWLKATGQCVLERYLSATMVSLRPAVCICAKVLGYVNSYDFCSVNRTVPTLF